GCVVLRQRSVVGASVPEASVDERGDPLAGEHDVRSAPKAWQGGEIDPVAEPHRVERSADGQLRCGVSPGLTLHPPTDVVVQGDRTTRTRCRVAGPAPGHRSPSRTHFAYCG